MHGTNLFCFTHKHIDFGSYSDKVLCFPTEHVSSRRRLSYDDFLFLTLSPNYECVCTQSSPGLNYTIQKEIHFPPCFIKWKQALFVFLQKYLFKQVNKNKCFQIACPIWINKNAVHIYSSANILQNYLRSKTMYERNINSSFSSLFTTIVNETFNLKEAAEVYFRVIKMTMPTVF